jgi:hypothetical protein
MGTTITEVRFKEQTSNASERYNRTKFHDIQRVVNEIQGSRRTGKREIPGCRSSVMFKWGDSTARCCARQGSYEPGRTQHGLRYVAGHHHQATQRDNVSSNESTCTAQHPYSLAHEILLPWARLPRQVASHEPQCRRTSRTVG